ncbi:hypothetical protein D3C81_1093750 [compost metagenome]
MFICHAIAKYQPDQAAKWLAHGSDATVIGVTRQARGEIAHTAGMVLQGTATQRASPSQHNGAFPWPQRELQPGIEQLLPVGDSLQLFAMWQFQPVFDGHPAQRIAQRFVPRLAQWPIGQQV